MGVNLQSREQRLEEGAGARRLNQADHAVQKRGRRIGTLG